MGRRNRGRGRDGASGGRGARGAGAGENAAAAGAGGGAGAAADGAGESGGADGATTRRQAYANPAEFKLSEAFAKYYKAQGIVPAEEWEAFVQALASPLPVTFRINPLSQSAPVIRQRLTAPDSPFAQPFTLDDGRVIPPPRPLPWYRPGGASVQAAADGQIITNAFHLDQGRGDLRRNNTLRDLHQWLVLLTNEGGISRQEAVSMVPPLLLDVQVGT